MLFAAYGFALTEPGSVTLLLPRRNHCSPLKDTAPKVESAELERNRTAVEAAV